MIKRDKPVRASPPSRAAFCGDYAYAYTGHALAPPDDDYVGPSWAAPGPRLRQHDEPSRATSKRRSHETRRMRSFAWTILVAVSTALVVLVLGTVYVALRREDLAPDSLPVAPREAEHELGPLPDGTLPASDPLVESADVIAESAWNTGTCGDFSKERDRTTYVVARGKGSAGTLRGRVAVLHVRVNGPGLKWSRAGELNVDRAALMSQRYILGNAREHGVRDLRYDVIPWSLDTGYALPSMPLNGKGRLDDDTMRVIREGAKLSIETALGVSLERVVGELRRRGYDAVAFVVYFPVRTTARDFAFAAYHGADSPEAAFVFSPTSPFGNFAVTVTHEGLHLFGADDLYRVTPLHTDDAHDIMGEYCTGFRQASIGAATAYAVGWTTSPPDRGYRFVEK